MGLDSEDPFAETPAGCFQLRGQASYEDVVSALHLMDPGWKHWLGRVGLILGLVVAVDFVMSSFQFGQNTLYRILAVTVICVVVRVAKAMGERRRLRRLADSGQGVFAASNSILSTSGIDMIKEHERIQIDWNAFLAMEANDSAVVLYFRDRVGHTAMLFRSKLTDPDRWTELVEMIESRVDRW